MKNNLRKLIFTAFMLSLGMILPRVALRIPEIGRMLLPMHIPVMICGFICGAPYGAILGVILPLLNSFLFTMPPLMPVAVAMSFELCAYGFMSGIVYKKLKGKVGAIYISLILSMIIGRLLCGVASFFLYQIMGMKLTLKLFFTQAVISGVPGIILQLLIIPPIILGIVKNNSYENIQV